MSLLDIPAIDHHAHPLWRDRGERFREAFTEGFSPVMASQHVPASLGYRRCLAALAEVYGCQASEEAVLAARSQVSFAELLARGHVQQILVDDGVPAGGLTLPEIQAAAGVPCRRILRLETLAEQCFAGSWERFETRLRSRLASEPAVAFKSIIAYRAGLDIRSANAAAACAAFGRLLGGTPLRVSGHDFEDWLLEVALETARQRLLPVQVHCGWGDPDEDLRLADPLHLKPLIEGYPEVPFVLLHCYPYHRQAAYLAAVYPNVYMDLSLAMPLAEGTGRILAETLELCPASKLLYGSDGIGIAERLWLGSYVWRDSLKWCRVPEELAELILHANAERLYALS